MIIWEGRGGVDIVKEAPISIPSLERIPLRSIARNRAASSIGQEMGILPLESARILITSPDVPCPRASGTVFGG